jgi:hypothetical protein
MDISKDPTKPEIDNTVKTDPVKPDTEPKATVKASVAAPIMNAPKVEKPLTKEPAYAEILKAKEPITADLPKIKESVPLTKEPAIAEMLKTKEPVAVDLPKVKQSIPLTKEPAIAEVLKAREIAVEPPKPKETLPPKVAVAMQPKPVAESNLAKDIGNLEAKINKRIEDFKKVDEKIRETDEEIEEIESKKRNETIGDKAKKIAWIAPKICVEANVCRFPKAVCKGCGKMVDVWKSASKAGLKAFGDLTGKFTDSFATGMRLPMIRMKMNKDFKELGSRAYKMYLDGDKNILNNSEIARIVDEVKSLEKQIEKLEAHLTDLNDQPVAHQQNA